MMNVKHQTECFFKHLMNTSLVLMVWSPPAAWIGCWSLYRHFRITTATEPDLRPTSCDMKEAILPGLVLWLEEIGSWACGGWLVWSQTPPAPRHWVNMNRTSLTSTAAKKSIKLQMFEVASIEPELITNQNTCSYSCFIYALLLSSGRMEEF